MGFGAGVVALGGPPAAAFSLFGIHLWGPRRNDSGSRSSIRCTYRVTPARVGAATRACRAARERLLALDRPRDPGLRQRRAALQGPRRLPAAAGRALRRRLLRAGDQHPRRRAGGRRPDPGGRVPAERAGRRSTSIAGPPFLFGTTRIVNAPPPPDDPRGATRPASVGFVTGKPALSGVINQASAISIERWRQLSRAKAREADRDVVADHPHEPARRDPDARSRAGGALRADAGRRQPARRSGLHRLHGRPARGRRRSIPTTSAPAQDRLNRLGVFSLDPLRRGARDRARRQPADHRARRGPQAAHDRLRRHALDHRRRRRHRPTGCTATSSAAPRACGSTRASTGSAAR